MHFSTTIATLALQFSDLMRSNRTNGEHEFAPGNFTNDQSPDIQFVSASNATKLEGSNPLSAIENAKTKTPPPIPVHKKLITGKFSKKTGLFILAGIAMLSLSSALIVKKNHKHPVEQNIVQATTSTPRVVNDIKTTEGKTSSTEEKEKLVRKNWREYIHVNNSNYAYGVIGGINNLSVLFYNKSDYRLEQVVAKITYIKANGKPWKSKLVSVFNVAPHSERKETLPKVNRGKSVEVNVEKVVSKEMHFNYEAGKKSANTDDPYLSK